MKKGHQTIKRVSAEKSKKLAQVLCHKAIKTKNLESQEYQNQIFAVRDGEETFSESTYKELNRELQEIRNVIRSVHANLETETLRQIRDNPKIGYMKIFDYYEDKQIRTVLDRFRKREKAEKFDAPLFGYLENSSPTGGDPIPKTEEEFEEEKEAVYLSPTNKTLITAGIRKMLFFFLLKINYGNSRKIFSRMQLRGN